MFVSKNVSNVLCFLFSIPCSSARNRNVSLHKSHSHVFTDDDSNMSWTSTSSVGRRKTRLQHPQSPAAARETSSLQASRGASSDSDEREGGEGEEPEKPRKVGVAKSWEGSRWWSSVLSSG